MQWQEVVDDPTLQDLPYKIELNEWGNIEMSPASFIHGSIQFDIGYLLRNQLGGRVFTELAIQTTAGVRVPDTAWSSDEYFDSHCHELFASTAPEICIEVVSPSNSPAEMLRKVALLLEAGALEVWLVKEDKSVQFYNAEGVQERSAFDVDLSEF